MSIKGIWAQFWGHMMSIKGIWGHLSHGPHGNHVLYMVITFRQTVGVTDHLGCLFCFYILFNNYYVLMHITTYRDLRVPA